ncbi:MAG TPA: XdhC/CoxI family protein [Candidatus Brocadiaceae bacterium]|nr:XdhC/CoxI family protein [Candidatus Brocadiaceae bacterium]
MIKIIEEALRLAERGEPFVIATVVRTTGSTPQKAGAKLLVRQDGSCVGTLGGGCIEGEIWSKAKIILREQGCPVFLRYDLNEAFAARDGLVCGGAMFFFMDVISDTRVFLPFMREIAQAIHGGKPVALATVVNALHGKSCLGAKLLVREDDSQQGTMGDSELEQEAHALGKAVLAHGSNECFQTKDGTEIFVEGYTTPPTLVLMGGGHVNKAVSLLAASVGFRIYVIDDRPEFANAERFPEAIGIVVSDYSTGLAGVPVNRNTAIVIATRGHRYDDSALAAAVQTDAGYVGLLGSKRKTLEIYKSLLKEKVPHERIREVRAPIGLNIGAVTPEELAVSIMSEIIMVRRGGDGAPMKMQIGSAGFQPAGLLS